MEKIKAIIEGKIKNLEKNLSAFLAKNGISKTIKKFIAKKVNIIAIGER